jgi:biotin operon repressor
METFMDSSTTQDGSQSPKQPWRVWIDSPVIDSASQVGSRALAVYLVLLRHADREHVSSYPGEEKIGKALGLSSRSVRDVINTLEQAGWIEVEREKGSVNVYSFPPIDTGRNLPHPTKVTGRNLQQPRKKHVKTTEESFRTTPEETFRLTELSEHNKNITNNNGRKAAGALEIPFPVALDVPAFHEAWEEWKQHRKEIKKKLTPTSVKQQFAKLESMGLTRAVAAITHSIENGWIGIFEPNGDTRNGNGKSYTPGAGQRHPSDSSDQPGSF